ncbi:MAG: hypothetical protein ACUZ8E_02775 [Candidatus Anammoxibacter sp.]
MKISSALKQGIKSIYPDTTLEESLTKIVKSEIKRKLLSFELLDTQYKKKYKMEFENFFKNIVKDKTPSFDEEDDYFNWEMVTSGIKELKEELNKI